MSELRPPVPIVAVPLGGPLVPARFVERPNRFVVHARLREGGEPVAAHLADPGRLRELLVPGRRLWLRPAAEPARATRKTPRKAPRKTRWSAVLVEAPGGLLVSVDTTVPNRLVAEALRRGALPELGPYRLERAEHRLGRSRIDFLLSAAGAAERPPLLLEVKSVTLVEEGVALFPDAVTARGARHLRELAAHARSGAYGAAVLFVAQRPDVERVVAARAIDPDFAEALEEARAAGVRVLARRCRVSLEAIALDAPVPAGV